MPRRKYKASAGDHKGTPSSYRPSKSDIRKGSPTREDLNGYNKNKINTFKARSKKKATKIQKKNFKNRRSFSEPDRVPQNAITLFCDGCCFPTNPGKCGWAFVECESGDRCFGGIPFATNNVAEMTGAIETMKYVAEKDLHMDGRPVVVFCDSQYVVRGCMQWLPKWKKNGWKKTADGGSSLKNVDLWKQIDELLEKTGVQFRWVKGHNGNHYNDMCDRLASEGAVKQIKKLLIGPNHKRNFTSSPVLAEYTMMSSFTEDFLVSSEPLLF